jgi:hypothetical protein
VTPSGTSSPSSCPSIRRAGSRGGYGWRSRRRPWSTPRLGEALREANTTSHTNLTRLLARARDAGLIHPDLDPADTATDLLTLVDGLTMQGLTDPDRFPPAHLIAVLERHIARLPAGSAPSER